MDGNIEITRSNSYFYIDSITNDILIYTGTSNQHILLGTVSNDSSAINIYRSNVTVNKPIFIGCNVSFGYASSNYATIQTTNDFVALANNSQWIQNHGGKSLYLRYLSNSTLDSAYIQSISRDNFSQSNMQNMHINASNINILTGDLSNISISSDNKVCIGTINSYESLNVLGHIKTTGRISLNSSNFILFGSNDSIEDSSRIGFNLFTNSNYIDIVGNTGSNDIGRIINFWIDSNENVDEAGKALFIGGDVIVDDGVLILGSNDINDGLLKLIGKTYIGSTNPNSNSDAILHLSKSNDCALSLEYSGSNISQIRLTPNNLKFAVQNTCEFSLISGMSMVDGSGGTEVMHINPDTVYIQSNIDVIGFIDAQNLQINGAPLSTSTGGGFEASNNNISFTMSNLGIGLSNPTHALEIVGDVMFSNTLSNYGNVYIGSTSFVKSNLYINQDIISSNTTSNIGNVYFASNLVVDYNLNVNQQIFASNLYILHNFNNSNSLSNLGHVFIGSNLVVNAELYIGQQVILSNTLSNLGDVYIESNLRINSNLYVNQQIIASNTLSNLGNVYFASKLLINSNLYVKQQVVLSNTLSNFDNAAFLSNVVMGSNLYVAQQVIFSNTLSNLNNASFSSNVIIASNLYSTQTLNSNTFSNLGISSFSLPMTVNSNLYLNTIQVLPNMSNTYFVSSNLRVNLQTKAISTSRVSTWDVFNQTSNVAQQPYWFSNTGIVGRSEVAFYTGSNSMMGASNIQFNIASNGGFTFAMYYKFRSNLNWERIMEATPTSNASYEQFVVARAGTTSNLSVAIAGNARMIQVAPIIQNTYTIVTYRYTVSNGNHSLWQNNSLLYSSNLVVSLGNGPWNIGLGANIYGATTNVTTGLSPNYSQFGNFSLQSLFMYDRALSDTEIGNLYNYMNLNYSSIASILNYAGIFGGSFFTSDGYIGVGTTNPVAKLNLSESNSNVNIRLVTSNSLITDIGIATNSNEIVTGSKKGDLYIMNTIGSNILFASTSNSNVMTITQSNIGIFKSNPAYTLDVNGSVNITSNVNILGVTTVASNIMPLSNLVYDLGSSNMRFRTIYLASNTIDMQTLQIKVDSVTGGLQLTDSNNSNVPLTVNKLIVGSGSNAVRIETDINNNVSFNNVTLSNGIQVSSSNASVGGWSNSSSNMFIMGSNVGIGLSPTKTLDVAGDINFTGGIYQAGVSYVSTNSGGGGISIDSNNQAILSSNSTFSIISVRSMYSPTQTLGIASSTGTDTIQFINIDASSNRYISGIYGPGTTTLYDSNANTSILNVPTTSNIAAFATKINTSGVPTLAVAIDNIKPNSSTSVVVDGSSNIILTGVYTSNIPVIYNNNSNLASNIPTIPTTTDTASIIVKYNSNAQATWAFCVKNASINSINVDSSRTNLILSGTSLSGSQPIVYDMGVSNITSPYTVSAYTYVSTIAGSGTGTYLDGTGTNASFNIPNGLCINSNNTNLYICDRNNNRIRKMNIATGMVSTFAGSGTATYLDGTGTNAGFSNPYYIAIDSSENLYVSDTGNNRIRKITSTGIVTTLAGSGTSTFVNGIGTNAGFNLPQGIAIDTSGVVYVADTNNNRIRKIIQDGTVTTFAGSGTATYLDSTGTLAGFKNPMDLVVDTYGVVYVADNTNNRIRKITPAGVVTTFAGSGTGTLLNGTGTGAGLVYIYAITISKNGTLYVTNYDYVRKITSSGVVTTIAGGSGFADGVGTSAKFTNICGIAVDLFENIYVSDLSNNRIRRIEMLGVQVNTLAGSGTATYLDAVGNYAGLNGPFGVAFDSYGILYVTDSVNNRIRKITQSGIVSTFAGSGTGTYLDATGTNAGLSNPSGIVADTSNNFYIADSGNHRIRKITYSGVVTTLAGKGTATYYDAIGTNAGFNNPANLTIDTSNNLYIADTNNFRIRKIATDGTVTTFAGLGTATYYDATGTNAGFNYFRGITVDSNGTFYVADTDNYRIRKITSSGIVTTIAGSGTGTFADGIGTNASFKYPFGILTDSSGLIYVSDTFNNRIRKITQTGVVTTLAGSGTQSFLNGSGFVANFSGPCGLAFDSTSNLYVAELWNNRIRVLSAPWTVSTLAGSGIPTFAEGTGITAAFNNPRDVALDAVGNIYVTDGTNHRIRKITPGGVVTTFAGSGTPTYLDGTGTNASFNGPHGIAIDSTGNIYISDTDNHRIRKITSTGVVTTIAGSGTASYLDAVGTNSRFNTPRGIAVDSAGNLYIGESGNHRIRKIAPDGTVTTLAGTGLGNFADGTGTNAAFNYPVGLTVDSNANIYVADYLNNRIRKITPSGVVTTFAGSASATILDGTGSSAAFNSPVSITLDTIGNFYVVDGANHRVRKISSAGVVTTIAGSGTATFADGIGTLSSFNFPYGVTVDASGSIYVVDYNNNRVRKLTPASTSSSATAIVTSSTVTLPTPVNTSALAIKYNSSGVSQWAITVDGGSADENKFVIADQSNNVYLVGKYGPNAATIYKNASVQSSLSNLTATNGSNAVFALKADSNGTPLWTIKIDGTGDDQGLACGVDTSDNLYIAGSYQNSNATIYSATNTIFNTLPDPINTSSFITKFNSSGITQWFTTIQQQSASGSNTINSLVIDNSNNIYATGYFSGSNVPIIKNSSNQNSALVLSNISTTSLSGFVIKYNSDGTPIQSLSLNGIAGNSNIIPSTITIDSYGSNLYIGGSYNSNMKLYNADNAQITVLPVCGSNSLQTGFITQYQLQNSSNFYIQSLSNSSSNDGSLKYVVNSDPTIPAILNILSSNQTIQSSSILNPGLTAQYSWYGGQWYKLK